MAMGDQISVDRGGYRHHGVDLGDGTVVHFNREADAGWGSCVRRTSRWRFARGNVVRVEARPAHGLTAEQVVDRAIGLIGVDDYDITERNCEHYAAWAVTNVFHSQQVRELVDRFQRAARASAAPMNPAPLVAWAAWEFALRLGQTLREMVKAREYLTQYAMLWVGDVWTAPDGRPFGLARNLHWVAATPGGLAPIAKPEQGELSSRLWVDPLQTTFTTSPALDRAAVVGAHQLVPIPVAEIPDRRGAPIPTLLRRSDSVFTMIERHGLPTPASWNWPE